MLVRCAVLRNVPIIVISVYLFATVCAKSEYVQNVAEYKHPRQAHLISTRSIIGSKHGSLNPIYDKIEEDPKFWNDKAQKTLNEKLLQRPNTNVAKNVIMFLGDGLSIPTIKASRIYWGQLNNETGEDREFSFEKFPYSGLSKTYCLDKQVPDSACTATAYLCGIKNNEATLGVTGAVKIEDCDASLLEENRVDSIAKWSQVKKKRTGFVTTTKITDASPAGLYAKTADRDWESDADNVPANCKDIAHQLIYGETGKEFHVMLGGGRQKFIPKDLIDEEGSPGTRLDGDNLIKSWLESKAGHKPEYVWNRSGLLNVSKDTEYLFGLFESGHCVYHLDADENEPSLAEMTEKAIEVLTKDENGFFLFVEGGRIDHAHHDNKAHKALDETVEFHKAIEKAVEMTNEEDTLIVVTADHAHVMTVSGYADRGNDILGAAGIGDDKVPYATLSYANGPSSTNGKRKDISAGNSLDKDYLFPAMVPMEMETHGGDEVAIFARGPWSHLLTGVIEQNLIPHIMAYASCVGNGLTICDQDVHRAKKSSDN